MRTLQPFPPIFEIVRMIRHETLSYWSSVIPSYDPPFWVFWVLLHTWRVQNIAPGYPDTMWSNIDEDNLLLADYHKVNIFSYNRILPWWLDCPVRYIHRSSNGIDGSDIVVSTSTNGTPVRMPLNKSEHMFTMAPISSHLHFDPMQTVYHWKYIYCQLNFVHNQWNHEKYSSYFIFPCSYHVKPISISSPDVRDGTYKAPIHQSQPITVEIWL